MIPVQILAPRGPSGKLRPVEEVAGAVHGVSLGAQNQAKHAGAVKYPLLVQVADEFALYVARVNIPPGVDVQVRVQRCWSAVARGVRAAPEEGGQLIKEDALVAQRERGPLGNGLRGTRWCRHPCLQFGFEIGQRGVILASSK